MKKQKGFTLLELIVVIIIIGILAAIAIAQYEKFIQKGREAEARAILGNIRTAIAAYKLEDAEGGCPGGMDDLLLGPVTGKYFTYDISGCTAIATAIEGGKTITLDYEGNWGGE